MKYGVRIHWGLYSMLPGARESWSFLPLSNEQRQSYIESFRKWDPSGFDAEGYAGCLDPCADIPEEGVCLGSAAARCAGADEGPRRLAATDCDTLGQVCGTDPLTGAIGCIDAAP